MKNIIIAGLIALSATSASAKSWTRHEMDWCTAFTYGICIAAIAAAGEKIDGLSVGDYIKGIFK